MFVVLSLILFFLNSVICASKRSRSPSPTSSGEWKSFLNLSPEINQAETHLPATEAVNAEPKDISRGHARALSNTKGAIKSRNYRAQLKGEDLIKYKKLRRESNMRAYKARKLLRESDPEAMAKYKEATKKRGRKYNFRNKAKTIEDPKEREEYLRKHIEAERGSRRRRYQRNMDQTDRGTDLWKVLKTQKERIRAGEVTEEKLTKSQNAHEKNGNRIK